MRSDRGGGKELRSRLGHPRRGYDRLVRRLMTLSRLSAKGSIPRVRVRCDQDASQRLRAICMSGMAAEAQIARWAGFDAVVSPRQVEQDTSLLDMLGHHDTTCLVSFGLAGGLAPGLRPGDVLISTHVITPHRCWRPPPQFRERMLGLARELGALEGAVFSSSTVIASPQQKAGAWRETGALAVDMESAVVASTANIVGIPFVVMRAIADPATQKLPPAAGTSFSSEQGISLCALLTDLLARPRQIPAVCTVALQAFRGLLALSRLARMLPMAPSFLGDPPRSGCLDRALVGGRQNVLEWSARSATGRQPAEAFSQNRRSPDRRGWSKTLSGNGLGVRKIRSLERACVTLSRAGAKLIKAGARRLTPKTSTSTAT